MLGLTERHLASIRKSMVPMATFMKESRSSVIASQQGHYAWLKITSVANSAGHVLVPVGVASLWLEPLVSSFCQDCFQPLHTECTCIITIGFPFNYSLPCRGLPSPQCQVLSTLYVLALVQWTFQITLKPDGYITLLIWPYQSENKLNRPYNLQRPRRCNIVIADIFENPCGEGPTTNGAVAQF